jgi:DNA-binding transcriptional LysR family regulator
MATPDFNLLLTLNAVLSEGSVVRAARRLQLSPSAMSRALARVREATGDPLLVRAGRGLVATPRALELRDRVAHLVDEAGSVLRPMAAPDLSLATRTFTVQTSEGFVETFGPALVDRVAKTAPGLRLLFVAKQTKDGAALRDGAVDLETGVIDDVTRPELQQAPLFTDRLVGVVRRGHALTARRVTPKRYASAGHIGVSRRSVDSGSVDDALRRMGLERTLATSVSGFSTAVALARASDLVATVPELHTAALRAGMRTFPLPIDVPTFTVSMMWHPRLHADPIHRWLRGCLREVCRSKSQDVRL